MSDQHLVALQGIWNEMKALNSRVNQGFNDVNGRIDVTNERLDATNERLDATNARLDATNARLDHGIERIDRVEVVQREGEIRIATELVALHGTMQEIRDVVSGAFQSDRARITKLERRVDVLEAERKK